MADESSALLQPSLQAPRSGRVPYSVQAQFLIAFFGGPVAALAMAVLNAERLDRVRQDAPWVLALLLLYAGLAATLSFTAWGTEVMTALRQDFGGRVHTFLGRLYALSCVGVAFWAHRRSHRARELMGRQAPSPWGPALVLVSAGFLVNLAWTTVMQ